MLGHRPGPRRGGQLDSTLRRVPSAADTAATVVAARVGAGRFGGAKERTLTPPPTVRRSPQPSAPNLVPTIGNTTGSASSPSPINNTLTSSGQSNSYTNGLAVNGNGVPQSGSSPSSEHPRYGGISTSSRSTTIAAPSTYRPGYSGFPDGRLANRLQTKINQDFSSAEEAVISGNRTPLQRLPQGSASRLSSMASTTMQPSPSPSVGSTAAGNGGLTMMMATPSMSEPGGGRGDSQQSTTSTATGRPGRPMPGERRYTDPCGGPTVSRSGSATALSHQGDHSPVPKFPPIHENGTANPQLQLPRSQPAASLSGPGQSQPEATRTPEVASLESQIEAPTTVEGKSSDKERTPSSEEAAPESSPYSPPRAPLLVVHHGQHHQTEGGSTFTPNAPRTLKAEPQGVSIVPPRQLHLNEGALDVTSRLYRGGAQHRRTISLGSTTSSSYLPEQSSPGQHIIASSTTLTTPRPENDLSSISASPSLRKSATTAMGTVVEVRTLAEIQAAAQEAKSRLVNTRRVKSALAQGSLLSKRTLRATQAIGMTTTPIRMSRSESTDRAPDVGPPVTLDEDEAGVSTIPHTVGGDATRAPDTLKDQLAARAEKELRDRLDLDGEEDVARNVITGDEGVKWKRLTSHITALVSAVEIAAKAKQERLQKIEAQLRAQSIAHRCVNLEGHENEKRLDLLSQEHTFFRANLLQPFKNGARLLDIADQEKRSRRLIELAATGGVDDLGLLKQEHEVMMFQEGEGAAEGYDDEDEDDLRNTSPESVEEEEQPHRSPPSPMSQEGYPQDSSTTSSTAPPRIARGKPSPRPIETAPTPTPRPKTGIHQEIQPGHQAELKRFISKRKADQDEPKSLAQLCRRRPAPSPFLNKQQGAGVTTGSTSQITESLSFFSRLLDEEDGSSSSSDTVVERRLIESVTDMVLVQHIANFLLGSLEPAEQEEHHSPPQGEEDFSRLHSEVI